MSTDYELLKTHDGFVVELGEHSNRFDLTIGRRATSDFRQRANGDASVSVNDLTTDDLKDLIVRLCEVYSYWATDKEKAALLPTVAAKVSELREHDEPVLAIVPITLRDMGGKKGRQNALVTIHDEGVFLKFDGYGEKLATDGQGEPVMVELCEGHPRVLVWSDINQEDPTHIISLEGALESHRNAEAAGQGKADAH